MDLYLFSLCSAWNVVTPESIIVWKQSNVGVIVPVHTICKDPRAVIVGSGEKKSWAKSGPARAYKLVSVNMLTLSGPDLACDFFAPSWITAPGCLRMCPHERKHSTRDSIPHPEKFIIYAFGIHLLVRIRPKSQSPPTLPSIISGSILFRSYLRHFSLLSCTFSCFCSKYVSSLIERQIDTVFWFSQD